MVPFKYVIMQKIQILSSLKNVKTSYNIPDRRISEQNDCAN